MERYNNPNITSTEFLREVMRSRDVAIEDRVKAASALMEIEPFGPPKPSLTIQIQCISDDDMRASSHRLSMKLLFESFPPELQKDLLYLKRCYEQGIEGPFEIGDMPIKGHA
jgi:hypothetical protein